MPVQRTEATWPVVYERVIGRITPEDTEASLAYLASLPKRKVRCAVITDFRGYEAIPHQEDPRGAQVKEDRADRLERLRVVIAENEEALRRYVVAVCYIVPEGPLRAILSGMLLALHPPYATSIVGDIAEAKLFCQTKLDR